MSYNRYLNRGALVHFGQGHRPAPGQPAPHVSPPTPEAPEERPTRLN